MPIFVASTMAVVPSIATVEPSVTVEPTHIDPKPTQNERISPIVEPIESSCVRYAESLVRGIPIINAVSYPLNTINPVIGDIIKIQFQNKDGFIYHIGVITGETENTWITANGNIPANATSTIEFKKEDERILGFFNPARQALIDQLDPIQRETLWNESGWSHYNTDGSIKWGMNDPNDGWGVAQIIPTTWDWLTNERRKEDVKPILLDKMNFEHQIIMFEYGWSKGVTWYGRPDLK